MDKFYFKEKIKLNTEWLRGFFALFVLDTTAVATLFIRQQIFGTSYLINNMLILTFLLDIFIFVMILVVNKKINKLINSF